jgi:hypothetical protein
MIMKRMNLFLAFSLLVGLTAQGQQKSDTVVVPLGKTSQVIFTVQDRADLEILKHYNFQELFQDILNKIEKSDSAQQATNPEAVSTEKPAETERNTDTRDEDWADRNDDNDDNENWGHYDRKRDYYRGRIGKTWQSFNFDLGTNNYLSDGKFQDTTFSVRPWGSWYLAASSTQRTRVGKKFFLEWGVGISWYNFKFQDDDVMLQESDQGVQFVTDTRDVNHLKSKLTVTYINASFVPVLDFGNHNRKPRMWDGYRSSFRIGLGPYVGYRIGSRTKLVYSEDNHREKEKERDSFNLSNLRYGARLQLGFYGTDLFFNYDLNELFADAKGPKLNAFSFGIIF